MATPPLEQKNAEHAEKTENAELFSQFSANSPISACSAFSRRLSFVGLKERRLFTISRICQRLNQNANGSGMKQVRRHLLRTGFVIKP
jgi:hypothetical protein